MRRSPARDAVRSILPFALRGITSRQWIVCGCMKLGRACASALRKASSARPSLPAHDKMDDLSQPDIRQSQCDGLDHQPRIDCRRFDFRRADPVARTLYHRVAPADKVQQTVRIAPDPVARPHRRAAIAGGGGRWPEPFGGPHIVLPIPLRHQRPAMHQLALFVRTRDCAVIIDHQHFGMGYRGAHRGRMAVDQRRIEIGRTERFGQAVHRDTGPHPEIACEANAPAAPSTHRRYWSAGACSPPHRRAIPFRQAAPTAAAQRQAW